MKGDHDHLAYVHNVSIHETYLHVFIKLLQNLQGNVHSSQIQVLTIGYLHGQNNSNLKSVRVNGPFPMHTTQNAFLWGESTNPRSENSRLRIRGSIPVGARGSERLSLTGPNS